MTPTKSSQPPESTPLIATIVVHYRCLDDSRRCLKSLRKVTCPNHLVIVVDNHSQDGSAPLLAQEFPECELMILDENLGYAGGNNRGIKRALKRGAVYIQILNPDVEVYDTAYLETLIAALQDHPKWAAVGPKVFYHSPDLVQKTWGYFPSWRKMLWNKERQEDAQLRPEDAPTAPMPAEVINGVCFLARSEVLEALHGFEESYFMYGEETDLCYRMAKAGWQCVYIPAPSIIHHCAMGGKPFDISHNMSRSSLVRFLRRHSGLIPASILFLILLSLSPTKCLRKHRPGFRHYVSCLVAALLLKPARPPKPRQGNV